MYAIQWCFRDAYKIIFTGGYVLTYDLAEDWIAFLNKEFPDLLHWIVPKTKDGSYGISAD